MESVRSYLLSVTAAALVCALIRSITDQTATGGGLIKLLCGLVLCFTVIRPLPQIRLDAWLELPVDLMEDARAAAAAGEDYTLEAIRQQVAQDTKAYIQAIGERYGAELQVQVTVSKGETPVPESVRLTGRVSADQQEQISLALEQELAIAKEDQLWTVG